MILLAANIVITLRAAGIILVSAQLILPAVTSFNLVKRLDYAILCSALVAILAASGGLHFPGGWTFRPGLILSY
jgi:ABC-type Mn2+/Zn2+ transport system permease subunit